MGSAPGRNTWGPPSGEPIRLKPDPTDADPTGPIPQVLRRGLAARRWRVGAVGAENHGRRDWKNLFSGSNEGRCCLDGRNHPKSTEQRCKSDCRCGCGVSQNALIRILMCVVHRARRAEGFSRTCAQLLLRNQQRRGRHCADLTHEPGADDPGEMTPHGPHFASLSCHPSG